jgi:hypothetical protein
MLLSKKAWTPATPRAPLPAGSCGTKWQSLPAESGAEVNGEAKEQANLSGRQPPARCY